ncbi:MAG TPA: hypothetical protein VFG39_01825 [Balneolaceae bacterium]|nr:hypothetical protein [Balneolaceae bacterium]
MHNWQRIFAYVTGSVVFGLLLILLSRNYLQYINRGGQTAFLFLLGFGLVFLNLNFGISRRFVLKAPHSKWACWVMAFITFLPTLFWVYTKYVGLEEWKSLFVGVVVCSAFLGSYLGIWRGGVKREKYIRRLREEEKGDLPDELKRPHDDLNKN